MAVRSTRSVQKQPRSAAPLGEPSRLPYLGANFAAAGASITRTISYGLPSANVPN